MSLFIFAVLLSFLKINNFFVVSTDTIYCVDTFTHLKYNEGNETNEFKDGTKVDSRQGCCNEDNTLCLIFDPCLTVGTDEKKYRAFLRGCLIRPHILLPFHSNYSSNHPSLKYHLKFNEVEDDVIELSVHDREETDNHGVILLKARFKNLQTNECDYFSRLGKKNTLKFALSFLISTSIGCILIFFFWVFEFYVLLRDPTKSQTPE